MEERKRVRERVGYREMCLFAFGWYGCFVSLHSLRCLWVGKYGRGGGYTSLRSCLPVFAFFAITSALARLPLALKVAER